MFAGETGRPVWRDALLYDYIRPKLKPHSLEWVDFQVMCATHASIGHRPKLDPKVTANAAMVSVWRSSSTQGHPLMIGRWQPRNWRSQCLGTGRLLGYLGQKSPDGEWNAMECSFFDCL